MPLKKLNFKSKKLILILTFYFLALIFVLMTSKETRRIERDSVQPEMLGDANFDLNVDGIDYAILYKNFNRNTALGKIEGDFDLNGIVDIRDYKIWQSGYFDALNRKEKFQSKVLGLSTRSGFFEKTKGNVYLFLNKVKKKILPEPRIINYLDAENYSGKEKTVEGIIKEVLNNKRLFILVSKNPILEYLLCEYLKKTGRIFPMFLTDSLKKDKNSGNWKN